MNPPSVLVQWSEQLWRSNRHSSRSANETECCVVNCSSLHYRLTAQVHCITSTSSIQALYTICVIHSPHHSTLHHSSCLQDRLCICTCSYKLTPQLYYVTSNTRTLCIIETLPTLHTPLLFTPLKMALHSQTYSMTYIHASNTLVLLLQNTATTYM